MAAAQGGNFWQAAGIAVASSGIASYLGGQGQEAINAALENGGAQAAQQVANQVAISQALTGAFVGGFSSEITGGSFVQGFATGLTVAGLNHALHKLAFQQKTIVINNTQEARAHYKNGNGEPATIGKETVEELLKSKSFLKKHNRIIQGKTSLLKGNFSVDMTFKTFHVGRTNINYEIVCASGDCSVTYELFANDGFWDADVISERTIGYFMDKWKPDGMGPNLEIPGSTPYPYISQLKKYNFPNPGYKNN